MNYWEAAGMEKLREVYGIGPMLAATTCDFKKPLHYPGTIIIRASVVEMRRTSFSILHRITDEEERLAAEGRDVIVLFNYRKGVKETIPADLRQLVETMEGRAFPINYGGEHA